MREGDLRYFVWRIFYLPEHRQMEFNKDALVEIPMIWLLYPREQNSHPNFIFDQNSIGKEIVMQWPVIIYHLQTWLETRYYPSFVEVNPNNKLQWIWN